MIVHLARSASLDSARKAFEMPRLLSAAKSSLCRQNANDRGTLVRSLFQSFFSPWQKDA
jgi:hypothetical protein